MAKLDLQPLDLEPVDDESAPAPQKKLDLQPLDLEPVPAPQAQAQAPVRPKLDLEPADEDYEGVKKIQDRSFWSAPLVGTEPTTDKELEAIARKHGVDADALKSVATNLGAHREPGKEDVLGELESSLGRGVGAGIPQFIAKKSLDDPNLRNAVDDVRELANQKRSFAQGLAENLVPVGAASRALGLGADAVKGAAGVAKVGLGKALAKGAAEGAATGAVYGLGGSTEGHEVSGATTGAAFGGTLGAGATSVGRLIGHLSSAEKAAVRALPEAAKEDLEQGANKLLKDRESSESIIRDQILKPDAAPLTNEQAATILREQLPEHELDALHPSEEAGALAHAAQDGNGDAVHLARAQEIVESRAKDLAEQVTRDRPGNLEEARAALQATGQGAQKIEESYGILSTRKAAEDYLDRTGMKLGTEDNAGQRTMNFFSDSQFPMRVIDEKLRAPISAERTLNEINSNTNRMRWVQKGFDADLGKIVEKNPEAVQALKSGVITDAIDRGQVAQLPEALQPVANNVKEFLEKWREFVNDKVQEGDPSIAPLNIAKREDYVPHLTLSPDKAIVAVKQQTQAALEQATQALGRPIEKLEDLAPKELRSLAETEGPLKELERSVQMFDNKQSRNGLDLQNRLRDTFESRESPARLSTMAKAAEERKDGIPEFLREKNTYILLNRWGQNTLRHLYLRQPIEKLGALHKIAEKAGAPLEAGYLGRHLQDMNGIRQGTYAAWTRGLGYKWQRQMADVISNPNTPQALRAGAEVGQVMPQILKDSAMQIYANLIGLRLKSHVQHLIQPFYKMMPELGGVYGGQTVLQAMARTVLHMSESLTKAEHGGYTPAEFVPQFQHMTAEGIRANPVYSKAMQMANKTGNASMLLYTKLYELNKAVALHTGQVMAEDLAAGSAGAQKSLSRFPTAVQKAVAAAPEQTADILGKYLADSQVYNYNRASMSEFGRTMGPLFSTFTKWPLATAGDILAEYRTKSAGKASVNVMRKYMAPLVALMGVQHLMFGDPDEMTDRQKMIAGAAGLGGMAPVMSLVELKKRDSSIPPLLDTAVKGLLVPAIHGLQNRDGEAAAEGMKKGFATMVQQFTPGSVWIRFLTDDLPTYLSGRRPDGDDFIDRTRNGAKQLVK